MRRSIITFAALTAAIFIIAACTDRASAPTAPVRAGQLRAATAGTCTTLGSLTNLVNTVFGAGSPNANSALGKLNNLDKQLQKGDTAGAQDQARNLIRFIQQKASNLAGASSVPLLISALECYAGLTTHSALVFPSDLPQIIQSTDGQAGIKLDANPVSEPTLVTVTMLPTTGPAPLITKLDQYPGYVEITQQSNVTNSLIKPVIVAVCPSASVPASVRPHLRLGHQASAGFELTPRADGSWLACTTPAVASASTRLRGVLRTLASLVTPKPLYARFRQDEMISGGVGGSAVEFSPFAPVDEELAISGGVGGSAVEFMRAPQAPTLTPDATTKTTSPTQKSVAPNTPATGGATGAESAVRRTNVIDCSVATVGTALSAECRPQVTLTTAKGTIMQNVPVSFAVAAGNGTTAVDSSTTRSCGVFGAAAQNKTNLNGKAGACWTVGATAGTNTLIATPSAGGDAPAGVTFSPVTVAFTVTATKITPTATATGGSFDFDNVTHPGSGTCSNALVPVLSYSGGGSAPTAAGTYTLTVTCGTGSNVYNEVTATATISIAAVVPVITVTCPASTVYSGAAQTPCSATAVAPGLSSTPDVTYSGNLNVGTATASVALAATGSYAAASGSATFQITPAATTTIVSCSASSLPYTSAAIAPCSATTTSPAGLNTPTSVMYTDNVNAGTVTASATYTATANYLASSGSASFSITPAATTTVVSCPASVTFNGAAQTPCTASALFGASVVASLTPSYAGNTNAGTATVTAAYAGSSNLLASSGAGSFGILPAASTVTVNCPVSVTYNGAAQTPCTAAVSGVGGLSGALAPAYANNTSVGTATVTASYAGGANWTGSAGSGSFGITKLGATAAAGSATINFGSAVPAIPCAVTGLLGVDAGSVTCTTSVAPVTAAGSFPTTPVVSPTNPANYLVGGVNGLLTVLGYTQVGCFSTPIYSSMPDTKSAQRKGSNLPIKCTLTNAQGVSVTTAKGNVAVWDRGTNAATAPTMAGTLAFSGTNVFSVSSGGNYSYGLDTSPVGFIAGHYYYVIATWNDGSTTKGWFLLK